MALADDIADYLQARFVADNQPFGFTVDSTYRLTDWWGDGGRHGFIDLQRGHDMLELAPFLHDNLASEPVVIPMVTTPRTGPVEVHIVPRGDDHLVLLLSRESEHDKTRVRQQAANERALLQAQQRKLIARQRDLIAELVEARTALERQRREAEQANFEKGRFIAMMSHEFRTPLASILGYAERINADPVDQVTVENSGNAIARAAGHLYDMINSVLDDAQLEAGRQRLHPRPVSPHATADDLAAIVAPLAAEKALSFAARITEQVPEFLLCDPGCLRQVLLNLLGNAVKYTDEGRIELALDWQDGELMATVRDDGPGISPSDQARLFEAFERGARHGGNVPGSGLGLAITLKLVRLMGGRLDMDSDVGAGCRVAVSVPAPRCEAPADATAIAPPPAAIQAGRPARLLICDDDADMRALHEYYLGRAGYEVLLAADGETALALARTERPDLVIVDIGLPGVAGDEVARRLAGENFAAPIVALSASQPADLDPSLFAARLRKPIRMPDLLAKLRELLTPASDD